MSAPIRIATRGSALALWQARHVASLLNVDAELVVIQTTGDQRRDVPIHAIGGQGVFVKEVQSALLDGRADIAVHSTKDLPSETAPGLVLAATPERGDARDALVGCSLSELPDSARVATGSVRRRAQLGALRPDLQFFDLRGNIETRLKKAADYDAIAMAYAPLIRLDRPDVNADVLDVETMLPQVGQGALAVECRNSDDDLLQVVTGIEHTPTRQAVNAERSFLASLGGGCDLPVGAYATTSSKGEVTLDALIASFDGSIVLREQSTGGDADALGAELAQTLLYERGGAELIRRSSSNADG